MYRAKCIHCRCLLPSFHRCIHSVTQTSIRICLRHPRKFSRAIPRQCTPLTPSNHVPFYCFFPFPYRVLPVVELHVNGIMQYVLVCVRLLSLRMFFYFAYAVNYITTPGSLSLHLGQCPFHRIVKCYKEQFLVGICIFF